MADDVEELFVRQVDVGVADVDLATEDEVINVRAVLTTIHPRRLRVWRRLWVVTGKR